ncbi:MAG: SCO family protein [Pseudomonadota bacterium]
MSAGRLALVAIALLAAIGGYWVGNRFKQPDPEPLSATVFPVPRPLPEFELVGEDETTFTRSDLRDAWHFVFFGYTYCPDICPTTLTRYTQVINRLAADPGLQQQTRVLFVSVDPARDTPERLGEYVRFFHPEFRGVTGDKQEIDRLAKAFSVFYETHEPDAEGNYLVDHSAVVAVVNPRAELAAFFSGVLDPEVIAADFQRIVARSQ